MSFSDVVASPRFLPAVLGIDAAVSLAAGALQTAAPDALSGLMGLSRPLLAGSGAFLLAYGALVGWSATRRPPLRPLVAFFALGNLGWTLACGALLAAAGATVWGQAWIAIQGVFTLAMADLQWLGLRATAPRSTAAA